MYTQNNKYLYKNDRVNRRYIEPFKINYLDPRVRGIKIGIPFLFRHKRRGIKPFLAIALRLKILAEMNKEKLQEMIVLFESIRGEEYNKTQQLKLK